MTLSVFSPTKETNRGEKKEKKNCFCALSKIIVSHHRKTPNDGRRENIPWQRGQRKITVFTIRKTLVSITSHPLFVRFSRRLSGYKKFSYASHFACVLSNPSAQTTEEKKKIRKCLSQRTARRYKPPSVRRETLQRARAVKEKSERPKRIDDKTTHGRSHFYIIYA